MANCSIAAISPLFSPACSRGSLDRVSATLFNPHDGTCPQSNTAVEKALSLKAACRAFNEVEPTVRLVVGNDDEIASFQKRA